MVVTKARWDETIKVQKKNSHFINKLGHNVYGSQALKMRTIGKPKEKGKAMATPKKVDAIVGEYYYERFSNNAYHRAVKIILYFVKSRSMPQGKAPGSKSAVP